MQPVIRPVDNGYALIIPRLVADHAGSFLPLPWRQFMGAPAMWIVRIVKPEAHRWPLPA